LEVGTVYVVVKLTQTVSVTLTLRVSDLLLL